MTTPLPPPPPATLWHYLRERFSLLRWGPVALLLCLACHATQPFASPSKAILHFGFLLTCILQFRIWDDLADLDLDREQHPQRVLGRVPHLLPYWSIVPGIGLFALLFLLVVQNDVQATVLYALLLMLTFRLYHGPTILGSRVVRNHLVLLKYPFLVALLRHDVLTENDPHEWILLSALMLSFAIHEIIDDPDLGFGPWSRIVYSLESALLLLLLGFLLPLSPPSPVWAVWLLYCAITVRVLTRKDDFRSVSIAAIAPFLLTATVLAVTL